MKAPRNDTSEMKKINFTKMAASGNDFVVCRFAGLPVSQLKNLAVKMCDRKYGVGADGLLVLEKSKTAAVRMRIFNADGSEAEMCGNGARCVASYSARGHRLEKKISIETKAGIIESEVLGDNVRIRLTGPKDYREDVLIEVNGRRIKADFINTGVPHAIVFVEGLEGIDATYIGRQIRSHKEFAPCGTNVNFVEVIDDSNIKVRTYERGVEDETLACGTGSVASAIILSQKSKVKSQKKKINVLTRGGEILKVYFDNDNGRISNVWLEGKVKTVYKGEWNV